MADTINITSNGPSKGAKVSAVALAFSAFFATTWPLIRAERDLSGFAGMGWDPAVDAWIRDAEVAHEATLEALKTVLSQPAVQEGDQLLRIVARIWNRVMRSTDASEVADLQDFIKAKGHLFRIDQRGAAGRAINRMLESALMRLQSYIGFINGPEDDPAPISPDNFRPKDSLSSAKAEAILELSA